VSCIVSHGEYFFVGNSKGYIRVFDLTANNIKDLKPLYDGKLADDEVICMDLSQTMSYLVSGYKSGSVALWDMKSYKLVKILNDVHTS